MGPFPGPTRFPRLPRGHARPYFITDGVRTPNNVPAGATNISVFEEADNVAITSFRVEVDPTSPSGYSAFLEVTNYSRTPKDVAIVVAGVAGQRVVRGVQLAPAGSWNEVMDLGAFRGGGVQARIQTEDDRFPADDVAFSYLPTRGEVNVTLVTPETDGYLEALLRLTPEVELTVTAPSAFEESVSTDVYVFDGAAPGQAPGRPSLVFGVPQTNWLPEPQGVDAQIRISSWDDDHPVMRFVPSYDLGIDEAFIVDPDGRNVVASSGSTPLILIDDGDGNQKTVLVTFSLASSDFAFHLGFPIFVENVLAWFSGETLAETRQLGEIELPLGTTAVTRLDGTPLDLATRSGQTVVELDEPDLLTAIVDGRRTRVAANMTDPERSDINGTSLTGAEDVQADVPRAGGELWFYMLLGATLLVATEWWTYHRRITV
jgi:hypothetical protein